MYAIIPAIDGVPQIGIKRLYNGMSISPTQAVAHFEGTLESGWTELTEEEFLAYFPVVEVVEEPIT